LVCETLTRSPNGFPSQNVVLMTDAEPDPLRKPTRNSIIGMLSTWLSLAEDGDTVLVYFAGHGAESDGNSYLLPSDAQLSNPPLTGLPLSLVKDRLRQCKARKKVLIIDSCHSGAGRDVGVMGTATAQSLFEDAEGLVTLSACDQQERSFEWTEKGHGAFTWFLAEGLWGKADADGDGLVTAGELNPYVWKETRRWAAERGLTQNPKAVSAVQGDIVLTGAVQGTGAAPSTPTAPPQGTAATQAPQTTAQPPPRGELVICESVVDGKAVGAAARFTGPKGRQGPRGAMGPPGSAEGLPGGEGLPGTCPEEVWALYSYWSHQQCIVEIAWFYEGRVQYREGVEIAGGDGQVAFGLRAMDGVPMATCEGLWEAKVSAGNRAMAQAAFTLVRGPQGPRGETGPPGPKPPTPRDPWQRRGVRAGHEITGPDGAVYVWVTPGAFRMGSPDGDDDEQPVHRVQITKGFWLAKHEVTNELYKRFCDETGREFPTDSGNDADHPVVYVNWEDAQAYCGRYGMRLPTEAEWEYSARGPVGNVYPWGQSWYANRACHYENRVHGSTTSPVGSFPRGKSWCGALDLTGNAWEWCSDWYGRDYYQQSPTEDPGGPESGTTRVIRGGSWRYFATSCRAAERGRYDPVGSSGDGGFRPLVVPDEAQ